MTEPAHLTLMLTCDSCGHPVTLVIVRDPLRSQGVGKQPMTIHHDGCDTPCVRLTTDPPREAA